MGGVLWKPHVNGGFLLYRETLTLFLKSEDKSEDKLAIC